MNAKDFQASLIAGALVGAFVALVADSLFPAQFNAWLLAGVWFASFGIISLIAGVGKIISRRIPALDQLIRFVIVGGLNTLVDFGVLNILIAVSGIASGVWYTVFKGISFIVAVLNSYWWNKFWTFDYKGKTDANRIFRFFTVSVVGFGVNVIIASVIVNFIPPLFGVSEVLWANMAAIVATAASMVWNFIGYKFFVFHAKGEPGTIFPSRN